MKRRQLQASIRDWAGFDRDLPMANRILRLASLIGLLLLIPAQPKAAIASKYHWWNTMIGATASNQLKLGNGTGVVVGVLDGLADYDLQIFGGRLRSWLNPDGTYNYFDNHATHVSGII